MEKDSARLTVSIDDHELTLSNLDKVMYPSTGFTKAEMLDYYANIAPVLLPHLHGRPVTVKRFPNGVENAGFIEKNVPSHAPPWIRTVTIAHRSAKHGTNRYALIDDRACLLWFVNLAAIEFHTPMWRVDPSGSPQEPDIIVFDLDPGEPASIVECCRVAGALRETLAENQIALHAKTSGSKGLQLYGSLEGQGLSGHEVSAIAHDVAEDLEARLPGLVVSKMTKSLRVGKVLIDWSQNSPAKTTISPYSMRATPTPRVSTPVGWDEVEACAAGSPLSFSPPEVLQRVTSSGDLLAPVLSAP